MVFPLDDPASAGLLFFGEISHEKAESSLVRRLAGTSRVVIDIGAHFGWYSLLMAGAMGEDGRVYAFEPNPHTFQYLQENAKGRNISVFPLAVSDLEKQITFYCAETSSLSSAVRSVGQPQVVEAVTLDQMCQKWEVCGQVDFVKCNVEGGELDVWRGAEQIRSSDNPPIWMLEVDEVFLNEAGTSQDAFNEEILRDGSSPALYCYVDGGILKQVTHIRERQYSNIFVVPQARREQFASAAGS